MLGLKVVVEVVEEAVEALRRAVLNTLVLLALDSLKLHPGA
jgi:hypothetical protein